MRNERLNLYTINYKYKRNDKRLLSFSFANLYWPLSYTKYKVKLCETCKNKKPLLCGKKAVAQNIKHVLRNQKLESLKAFNLFIIIESGTVGNSSLVIMRFWRGRRETKLFFQRRFGLSFCPRPNKIVNLLFVKLNSVFRRFTPYFIIGSKIIVGELTIFHQLIEVW